MTLTAQDLDDFHQFAREKLEAGEAGLSLMKLVSQWQAIRRNPDTDGAICEAINQMNAGLGESLDEAMEDIRRRLGDFRRMPLTTCICRS